MKLTHATMLEGVAEALRDQIAPRLEDGFSREAVRMAQSLILIASRATDDAAAIRVEENARIRVLCGEGAVLVDSRELRETLVQIARSADPGLKISELDRENGRLRLHLIELHAWLEGHPGPDADALSQSIWRSLRDFELARAPRA